MAGTAAARCHPTPATVDGVSVAQVRGGESGELLERSGSGARSKVDGGVFVNQTKLFNSDTDWNKSLLKLLWLAWQERPPRYIDATGASMAMDINSQFQQALAGDERSGIPVVKEESNRSYVSSRSFVEVNVADYYSPTLHRLRLSVDQARILRSLLNEFFSSIDLPDEVLNELERIANLTRQGGELAAYKTALDDMRSAIRHKESSSV